MIDAPPKTIRVVIHQRFDWSDYAPIGSPAQPPTEATEETVWPVGFPLPTRGQEIAVGEVSGEIRSVQWRIGSRAGVSDAEPYLAIELEIGA